MVHTIITSCIEDAPITAQLAIPILTFDHLARLKVDGAHDAMLAFTSLADLTEVRQVVVLLAPLAVSGVLGADLDGAVRRCDLSESVNGHGSELLPCCEAANLKARRLRLEHLIQE